MKKITLYTIAILIFTGCENIKTNGSTEQTNGFFTKLWNETFIKIEFFYDYFSQHPIILLLIIMVILVSSLVMNRFD